MSLYGASAVKDSSEVQLAVYLENFETDKVFDRLGNSGDTIEIAGIAGSSNSYTCKNRTKYFCSD